MGSVGPSSAFSSQLGSNAQSPDDAAPVRHDDDSFASTNPSLKQQTGRMAVVHAMVQHEQDTAEHRKKARAKDRGTAKKIHPVQKSVLEPHQSQDTSKGPAKGRMVVYPSYADAVGRPGNGASSVKHSSKAQDDDGDDLAALMSGMDIDDTSSEPELSESATTVGRGTPTQSPTTVHSVASITPNRSPQSPTPWRPPVNYLSKPTIIKHDQSVPSLSSPPTSPHRPSPFVRQPTFGPPQRPFNAPPASTQAQPFPPPAHFQMPPVQPLLSPFMTPPARVPTTQTPQPGSYFTHPPSSQFPPPVPSPALWSPASTHPGSQPPHVAPPGAVDPHAPEFVPRWKMDGIQRFSGRARPFQRLLDDYQQVQGGPQNKQQDLQLQLQLQLALQLQTNGPQAALQTALEQAGQGAPAVQTEDPARRMALQQALDQAMRDASSPPAPAPPPAPVDEARRMALQNALQRAMANQPPSTPPQPGTPPNWQFPGPQPGPAPQVWSPQSLPPGFTPSFPPPSPSRRHP
ncbi:hypothetical protein AURDEDRAFT_114129 [Auricularia subglabra TFB-10046 SS5]|nr:hypothetical protein AURDEDRAFT_114129 [Auricularia subglabra TFB-10046 SS5]